jgi:hypothetical protein
MRKVVRRKMPKHALENKNKKVVKLLVSVLAAVGMTLSSIITVHASGPI